MMRPLTIICMLLAIGSGLYLYRTKHRAQLLDREIHATLKSADEARARAGLLRADYALLNDPIRLQELADQHLQLRTTAPTQFTTLADLERRMPAIGLPPPPPPPEPEIPATVMRPPPAEPRVADARATEPRAPDARGTEQRVAEPPRPAPAAAAPPPPRPAPPVAAAKPPTPLAAPTPVPPPVQMAIRAAPVAPPQATAVALPQPTPAPGSATGATPGGLPPFRSSLGMARRFPGPTIGTGGGEN